jgi:GNAT superfamily N-acetyltransferase
MPVYQIVRGYVPGAIGRVTQMHAAYYHREWGFGLFFEARVAVELAEFLGRCDQARDGFWTARVDGSIEGAIAIDGLHAAAEGAHLRWFIVSDALHGQGAGGRLLETAIGFCRACGYRRVTLNTFEGLHAARRLYERAGFRVVAQQPGAQWGREVNEQRFDLDLGDT